MHPLHFGYCVGCVEDIAARVMTSSFAAGWAEPADVSVAASLRISDSAPAPSGDAAELARRKVELGLMFSAAGGDHGFGVTAEELADLFTDAGIAVAVVNSTVWDSLDKNGNDAL